MNKIKHTYVDNCNYSVKGVVSQLMEIVKAGKADSVVMRGNQLIIKAKAFSIGLRGNLRKWEMKDGEPSHEDVISTKAMVVFYVNFVKINNEAHIKSLWNVNPDARRPAKFGEEVEGDDTGISGSIYIEA